MTPTRPLSARTSHQSAQNLRKTQNSHFAPDSVSPTSLGKNKGPPAKLRKYVVMVRAARKLAKDFATEANSELPAHRHTTIATRVKERTSARNTVDIEVRKIDYMSRGHGAGGVDGMHGSSNTKPQRPRPPPKAQCSMQRARHLRTSPRS